MRSIAPTFLAIIAIGLPSSSHALLTNGDFETGSLTGWSAFAVPAGGPLQVFGVDNFDTDGDGTLSLAAGFRVGGSPVGGSTIAQNLFLGAGSYLFSADVATHSFSNNADGGTFELLFDSVVVDIFASDFVMVGSTNRHVLQANLEGVVAGTHEVQIRVTRRYGVDGSTPIQFVDNVALLQVPEPRVTDLVCLGLLIVAAKARHERGRMANGCRQSRLAARANEFRVPRCRRASRTGSASRP